MGSPWTDKSAILRDLSFAQGRWVPGGIDVAVAGGKPPAQNITEETEEEYYQHWTTDGDFSSGPDLSLIKKMLEMVHDEEPEAEDIPMGSIEITKTLNPVAKDFVPITKKTQPKQSDKNTVVEVKPPQESDKKTELMKKPLRVRNVAIASLIAISEKLAMEEVKDVPLKLSKPEDFIKVKETPVKNDEEVNALNRRKDSVNKVNNWLLSQDRTSMFKKKSSLKSVNENSDERSTLKKKSPVATPDGSVQSPKRSGKSPKKDGQYVPSSWAREYYKKCVDRSHMQELVKENIWVQAEKIMKEIDDKKAEELRQQKEAEAALAAEIAVAESVEAVEAAMKEDTVEDNDDIPAICKVPEKTAAEGIAKLLLPQHRHLLTGECIVCKVLSKKKPLEEELFETEPKPSTNEVSQSKSENNDEIIEEIDLEPETESNEEQLFCLVRSTFVGNLSEITEAPALNCMYTSASSSLEELDIFA